MRNRILIFLFLLTAISSCSCNPENIAKFAFKGMETMMGKGFMPSEEIRMLGKFQGMNVNLSKTTSGESSESTIFLKLENGDPLILGNQPEVLARKCAELYLRDFEKAEEYQQITVQFIQTDPTNPENVAMEEYIFDTTDFQ